MTIWYINHYASPPGAGLPGRPYFLASSLNHLGHRVINICASCHHFRALPTPNKELGKIVTFAGVEYLQLPARPYTGNGLDRVLNMLSFAHQLKKLTLLHTARELPKPDIIIPSCVHPFVFPPAMKLAATFDARLIYEVRDIWPLSLVELAGISTWHPLVLWMNNIERRAYRQADEIVSLMPKAYEHMQARGLAPQKFNYIPNGVSLDEWDQTPDALPAEHLAVFERLKRQGKVIVLYAGAHGPPNALDQILNLASLPGNEDPPYHFVLIGDGIEKTNLSARISVEKITFVDLLPKITKPQVMTAMRLSDVCFFSLRPASIFRFGISPNKLADYLMAGKPLVSACAAGNDPVTDANAGITVPPYAPDSLDNALRQVCAMSQEQRDQLGSNGREYVLRNLEWSVLGSKYNDVIRRMHVSHNRHENGFCHSSGTAQESCDGFKA